MSTVTKDLTLYWNTQATTLTESDINMLFEIFGPFPIHPTFTVRSGLIGLGKTRMLIQNQDELRNALFYYINLLTPDQQTRVKSLISEWSCFATKVNDITAAERVKFRTIAPEEHRKIIKHRLQTYISIYDWSELPEEYGGSWGDNFIMRG